MFKLTTRAVVDIPDAGLAAGEVVCVLGSRHGARAAVGSRTLSKLDTQKLLLALSRAICTGDAVPAAPIEINGVPMLALGSQWEDDWEGGWCGEA